MTGKMLINLDSEDEGEIFVSCAGGQTTHATFHFSREEAPAGYFFMEASLKGLNGGPVSYTHLDVYKRQVLQPLIAFLA